MSTTLNCAGDRFPDADSELPRVLRILNDGLSESKSEIVDSGDRRPTADGGSSALSEFHAISVSHNLQLSS